MQYTVSFQEINFGSVTVNAHSAEKAKILAEQAYAQGKVVWKDSQLKRCSIRKEAERGEDR